jgi:hypothetical protein
MGVTFEVRKTTINLLEFPQVTFSQSLSSRSGEKFWITVAKVGTDDTTQAAYQYLNQGMKEATLRTPVSSGNYEIRLHARNPKAKALVVCRRKLAVVDAPGGQLPPDMNVTFKLEKDALTTEELPKVIFSSALSPRKMEQYWITVVPAKTKDTTWGAYQYLKAGAKEATLKAASVTGAHEVRLYARNPLASSLLIHRQKLTVTAAKTDETTDEIPMDLATTFSLQKKTLQIGEAPVATFNSPLKPRPKEQFWITIVKFGAKDNDWGLWQMLGSGDKQATLKMPTAAGDYEVRLHGRYPTKNSMIIHRQKLTVDKK